MTVLILGGGLAAMSLADELNTNSIILEKESAIGGLCRSFVFRGISYDIGPHIIFSKNERILNKIISLVSTQRHRRINKILHLGKYIKYPFENNLAALPTDDRNYCLNTFLQNPYESYPATNMLQFFLKTFGEGITEIYLKQYNKKIWKFDPAFLDTQMVERIPKPPKEDIIKSANGIETEGYLHQLYFHYPSEGGIQSIITTYYKRIANKTKIVTSVNIEKIERTKKMWKITTDKGKYEGNILVSTLPPQELIKYTPVPPVIQRAVANLKYNSIYIAIILAKKDTLGDIFALYIPDKEIIFHRIAKLNFLGTSYQPKDGSALLAEITYRPDNSLADFSEDQIKIKVQLDLEKLGLVAKEDIIAIQLQKFKYAYVIYDLMHRQNTDTILSFLKEKEIYLTGRFALFEYMNMDQVIDTSEKLAETLNQMDK